MKKFIATNCEFRLHEDDWNEGEGKLISVWNEELGEADTIVELLENVPYLDKCYGKCSRIQDVFEYDSCYENTFNADLTIDIEDDGHDGFRIIKPTEEKWNQFENGKVKLYALHIVVHIQKVCDLDINDIGVEGW